MGSYKNMSYLVIANNFSSANSKAKTCLFETYDQLRDLTVSGSTLDGGGFGKAGSFLWNMASLLSPAGFMPLMGGTQAMNIPGTSYWSPYSTGQYSSFGIGNLSKYPGFPSGAAPASWGFGSASNSNSSYGYATGGASALTAASDIAGITGLNAAAYTGGTVSGWGYAGNWVMPMAGLISGWGGIMTAAAPYLDMFGLPAVVMGNLMQGTSSAALSAYQTATSNITSNADTILSNKVRNIETVVKMLDAQGDVVKKMLKEDVESTSKNIQDL